MDAIAFDGSLFNLAVLIPDQTAFGIGVEPTTVLAMFETVDPQNLSEIEWTFRTGIPLKIVASSSPGARRDLHFVFEPNYDFVITPDILVPGKLQGSILKVSETTGSIEVVGSFSTTIEIADTLAVHAGKTKISGEFYGDIKSSLTL